MRRGQKEEAHDLVQLRSDLLMPRATCAERLPCAVMCACWRCHVLIGSTDVVVLLVGGTKRTETGQSHESKKTRTRSIEPTIDSFLLVGVTCPAICTDYLLDYLSRLLARLLAPVPCPVTNSFFCMLSAAFLRHSFSCPKATRNLVRGTNALCYLPIELATTPPGLQVKTKSPRGTLY